MIRLKYYFIGLVFLCSCTNQELDTSSENSGINSFNNVAVRTPQSLRAVGGVIAEMGINLDMVKSVHTSIVGYHKQGSDEHMALEDLFSSEARSLKFNQGLDNFRNALIAEWNRQEGLRNFSWGGTTSLESFLKENNITLYWPNSDVWDGKTIPVIAVSTDNDLDESCVAYRLVKINNEYKVVESFLVDEAYAQNNPVWVINREALPYKQKEKSGLRTSVGHRFATLYLGSLQPTQHHDAWHKGGDEYHIEVSGPKHIEEDGKIRIIDKQYVFTRQEFTRKEIKRRSFREFKNSIILVSEWQRELNEIAVYIYENDASLYNQDNVKFKLSATWNGKEFGVDTDLPFASGDDELYKGLWKANLIFSTGNYRNNQWVQHNASGLLYTLPFETNRVIYDPSNPIGFEP